MGHLFVVRADVSRLHSDAWLLPTDASLRVNPVWLPTLDRLGIPHEGDTLRLDRPPAYGDEGVRVVEAAAGPPRVIAANTGGHAGKSSEWYLEGVDAFLREAAAADLELRRVALPVVGVGEGGQAERKGGLIDHLLDHLRRQALALDLEIVLVAPGASVFTAAQALRRAKAETYWPKPQTQPELAAALAESALAGRLVLFLGAGISKEVSLPTWDQLLKNLARKVGLSDELVERLEELPPGDRARVIESKASAETVRGLIAESLAWSAPYSLTHALLAGLPVSEFVTTNYDQLFEQAAKDAGRPVAVLPYRSAENEGRWLLKLHGDVDAPQDVVITRDDYLGYTAGRGALAGIVQALLITRQMVFVGFSLRDENVHRIVYEVKTAVRRGSGDEPPKPFGKALMVEREELVSELWSGDLDVIVLGETADEGSASLHLLLDRLLAETTTAAGHLFDSSFDELLTADAAEFRKAYLDAREKAESLADPSLRALALRAFAILDEERS